MPLSRTLDDIYYTGITGLIGGDRVNIVSASGEPVAGPLKVNEVFVALGDWIHLVDEATGKTFSQGRLTGSEDLADFSQLPKGWRFEKLATP